MSAPFQVEREIFSRMLLCAWTREHLGERGAFVLFFSREKSHAIFPVTPCLLSFPEVLHAGGVESLTLIISIWGGVDLGESSDDWLKRPLVTSPPSGSKDRKAVCSTQSKTSGLLSLGGTTRSQSLVAKSHKPKETEFFYGAFKKEN